MRLSESTCDEQGQNPALDPLPCDRWVARSCFQKAIRRGDAPLAVRALANLFLHDPAGVWRHLTIVALEDIGVVNSRLLQQIVEAKTRARSRHMPGALWKTQVELTQALAASQHCQATCDLLLRIENDPALSDEKRRIAEAGTSEWAKVLYDGSAAIERSAIAALCFGGFMNLRRPPDASAVFEILAECGYSEVAGLAQGAWRLTRNAMALLFPLVWQCSHRWSSLPIADNALPRAEIINGVPEYALDQFTRIGKSVMRRLIEADAELQSILAATGMSRSHWSRMVGDVIFLIEGGVCLRRSTYEEAEALRWPTRWLPSTPMFGPALHSAITHIAAKHRQLTELRQQFFQRPVSQSV